MGNNITNKDEIDLIDLFIAFWKERKILFYTIGLFIIIGLIIAFTSKEEYTARVRLMPERPQQNVSMSLARQFGIGNLPTSSREGISTRFYPDIVQSSPFLLPILDKKVFYSEIGDSVSIMNFFNNHYSDITFVKRGARTITKYTIHLPLTVVGWFRKEEAKEAIMGESQKIGEPVKRNASPAVIDLTWQQTRAINRLRSRINISNQDGIITLSSIMPEPEMATDLVDYATSMLIEFIKAYNTEKSRADVDFVEERYKEVQIRFRNSQERLARFRDENRGQLTQMARTEEQRLQSEYELAFNVYNTLARRLEEARLDLQEETPVVKVLEPAVIPTTISQPRREFILIMYTLLGIFSGFALIFFKQVRVRIMANIRQKNSI